MSAQPHFSVFGVPVRVEPVFFLIPLFALQTRSGTGAAVWAGLYFLGVLLHELGHALTMKHFGFSPSVTLHGLGGATHWPPGAVPTPRQNFFITLAGPGTGLVVGGLVYVAQRLWLSPPPLVSLGIRDALWVNVGWSLINLLPVLPWDGGQLLDAGLRWATGREHPRVVATSSVLLGVVIIGTAVFTRQILLGYFGINGLLQGLARWSRAERDEAHARWWKRVEVGDDVGGELEALLSTQTDLQERAFYAELLAWARLHQRDYDGARAAVSQLEGFTPSRSLRARLAAAADDVDTVLALLEGQATEAELPLLVSALVAKARFDDVVRLAQAHPALADVASTRLFHAGAWVQALELLTTARVRTGDGRFAYNEACCLCRLGRLDEAVAALQLASTLGFPGLQDLRSDEDLAPVRERPEVEVLLAQKVSGTL